MNRGQKRPHRSAATRRRASEGGATDCCEDSDRHNSHGIWWERALSSPGGISSAASRLRELGCSKSLSQGKLLHALLRARGIDRLTFVGNCLIEMYANCGCPQDSDAAFRRISSPNVFSWNMLIKAYAQSDDIWSAFHAFCSTPLRDTVTWNAMISSFARRGLALQALHLFYGMKEEGFAGDRFSFVGALDACAILRPLNVRIGQDVHAEAVGFGLERNTLVCTAALNMYGKCGSLRDARHVFEQSSDRDVAMWNAVIGLLARAGSREDALSEFGEMMRRGFSPDHVSFISALEACTLEEGQLIHAAIVDSRYEQDEEVSTALFSMYGKQGSLFHAKHVFESMSSNSLVVWNAMIAVFSQNNRGKDAVRLYNKMHLKGLQPDKSTYTTLLDVCANLAAIEEGQDVYRAAVCHHHDEDILLCNSLISFYGECGGVYEARKVFERMLRRDRISWTAIITASVQNGDSVEALRLFELMQLQGFQPDDVTFVSVLTGCSRSGLLEEGAHFFVSMHKDHGIAPSGEHYLCLIYLLARAGRLDDAEELIENVPSGKLGMAWLSLLGACRIHYDTDRGCKAAENCVKFIPGKVLSYILLSNLYAEDQMWPENVLSL